MTRITTLSVNPLIGTIDDFVTEDQIALIQAGIPEDKLSHASVVGADGPLVSEDRVAQSYRFHRGVLPVMDSITGKVAELFRLKVTHCEPPELIAYDEGGVFKRYFDGMLSGAMKTWGEGNAPPSQRIFTAILYLNDGFSGGQTRFPRLDLTLTPKAGRLAFWQNTRPGKTLVHHNSMHEGCPVTQGHKRIISFWFRDIPFSSGETG